MNIKTPVTNKLQFKDNCLIVEPDGMLIASALTPQIATDLAAIINLHAELVQFVKHISERAGIESVERHQAHELLAKCENIGKGETP